MKVLIALCFLLSSVLAKPEPEAEAKPWHHPKRFGKSVGHHHPYGPGPYAYGYHALPARLIHARPVVKCHTVYDTTYATKCKNVPERICKAVPVTKYRTDYKAECHAVPEKVCHPVTRTVPDKVCHSHPEKLCRSTYKTVYDTTYEEQCEDIEHKTCKESRVVAHTVHPAPAPVHPAPVIVAEPHPAPVILPEDDGYYAKEAPHGLAFTGRRIHKREAKRKWGDKIGRRGRQNRRRKGRKNKQRKGKDYAVPAPHCTVDIEHVCHKVPVKLARQIEVPHCTLVPKTVCKPTVREIVETKCHEEPREVCHKVPIEVPYTVPVEKCKLVPHEICKKVPHKHPREVCAHGYGYAPAPHPPPKSW